MIVTMLEEKETHSPTSASTVVATISSAIQTEKVVSVNEVDKVETVETSKPNNKIIRGYNVNIAMDRVSMPSYNNSLSWDHMSSLYA